MRTGNKQGKAKPPVMYVGPTSAAMGVVEGTIYTEVPAGMEAHFEACPLVRSLFVAVGDYPRAESDIRCRDGYFWTAYKAALDYERR